MPRARFQVLIIPYRIGVDGQARYLLFKRFDLDVWQWIAGGGEDDEKPEQTARREALEEAGIPEDTHVIRLDSMASIPAIHFADHHLSDDIYVIPEYSFGIECQRQRSLGNYPLTVGTSYVSLSSWQRQKSNVRR